MSDVSEELPLERIRLEFLDGTLLKELVVQYLAWDQNPTTRQIVKSIVGLKDVSGLDEILGTRLQFGTAGLRGKMRAGFNGMNELVIIQTTQGFVTYLESVFSKEELIERGVVIGYDGRHNSFRFALLATNIFFRKGYRVCLHSDLCPTPFVPFAVKLFKCCAGIMVTASHNPKEDNGYKVYWKNGAQIISPHDKGIQNCILENLEPWADSWEDIPESAIGKDKSFLRNTPLLIDPLKQVLEDYYSTVCEKSWSTDLSRNVNSKLRITYTAMHGVGYGYMSFAFHKALLPGLIPVREQTRPDPEFPTVKFPNPEEGESALNLAIKTANKEESTLILANDPDADRLAVAEKLPSGEWKIFNGNEIGALLGWWCYHTWVQKNGRENLKDCYMISSTVSSKILRSIANKEGFQFEETLTGFKWMANLAVDLMEKEKMVLFAFEEAIGFMWDTVVLDKDGISAGVRVAELASTLQEQGLTLNEQLRKVYEMYGYHVSRNSYYLCYNPETIAELFASIRAFNESDKNPSMLHYPSQLLDGKYKVNRVRDLTTGFDSGEPSKKATLPVSKGSQMLTFTFDNGLVLTLRTSGTEPKIKYYTELCASPNERDWNAVKLSLDEMVTAIIGEWIQPEKWGLQSP